MLVGDDVITASPGTWVWGPRGVPHGYQIHSARGRHLSLTMPGGFEAFFEEVASIATPDANPRNEMSRLVTVAARCGVDLLGPPSVRGLTPVTGLLSVQDGQDLGVAASGGGVDEVDGRSHAGQQLDRVVHR